jgi:hypothetical protein
MLSTGIMVGQLMTACSGVFRGGGGRSGDGPPRSGKFFFALWVVAKPSLKR